MDIASLIVKVSTTGVQTTQAQLDKLSATASNAQKSAGGLNLGMIGLTATLGLLTKEAIKMGDEWTNINSKLNLVTKTTQEFNKAQTELFNISQNTRTSLSASVELYRKLAVSTESLNISQNRLLKVTETINKAGIIGGGSKESINAALIQLGQGLASGALRGEELNSVLEQTPRLAKLIADGMGVQVGALKSLAEAGKITSETIIKAAEAGAKGIEKEFDVIQVTFSSSMEVAEGSVTKLVGTLDEATGATRTLSQSIIEMSKYLNENNTDIVATGQFIYATISRTIDVFNVLYETVENTGQIVVGHINLLAYGSLEIIYTMLTKVTEGLNVLGIASDKGLNQAYEDLKYIQGLVANANNLIADSYDDLNKAVIKLSPTIEDRIKQYNDENKAIKEKLALQKKELETTKGKSKLQVEAELKLEKEKEDKKKKAQKEAEKLAEQWAKRKVEIATETAIAEQDEMSKPYILLQAQYEADLKEFGSQKGAKEDLERKYQAELQKLNEETVKKFEDGLEKEAKKSAEWQVKLLEANEKYNDEIIKMQDEMYGTDTSVDAWYNNQLEYLGKLSQESGATAEELQTLLDKIETLKAMKLEKQTISFKVEQSFYQSFEDNLAESIEDAFNGDLNFKKFFRNIGNDLLKTLSSSFAGVGTSALRGNYSSVLGLLGTSAIGSTVSASEIGSLMNSGATFDSATNTIKTAGGTVLNLLGDGSGTIATVGTDAMSLISTVSTLKTAYTTLTGGMASYIDSGLAMLGMGGNVGGTLAGGFINPATLSATSTQAGAFINPATLSAQSSATSAATGASYGTVIGGSALGGAIGYGVGKGLDSVFGAKTYAGETGAVAGAALGGYAAMAGGLSAIPVVGWIAAAALLIAGGAIGKKQLKDAGISTDYNITETPNYGNLATGEAPTKDNVTVGFEWLMNYKDWEQKSWFGGSKWTNESNLPIAQRKAIESTFKTYNTMLDGLGSTSDMLIKAGKYTGESIFDAMDKSFIENFTGIPQKVEELTYYSLKQVPTWMGDGLQEAEKEILAKGSLSDDFSALLSGIAYEVSSATVDNKAFTDIYDQWKAYADNIDKTVTEALTISVGTYMQSVREFTIWELNQKNDDLSALSLTAKYAKEDLESITKTLGVTGVTVENFTEQYASAIKNSFDPNTISQWNSLGTALRSSTDAQTAYTNALFAQANSIRQMAYDLNSTMLQIQGQSNSAIATQLAFDNLIASAKKEGINTAEWERYTASQFASAILANPTYLSTMSSWLSDRISSGKEGSLTASALNTLAQQAYNSNQTIQQAYNNTTYTAVNNIATVQDSFLYMLESVNDYIADLTNRILGYTDTKTFGYNQAKIAFATGAIDFNTFQGYADDYLSSTKNKSTSQLEYLRAIASVRNDMLLISGSHANGLDYVPYDGYIAELHKGEKVQTASEVQKDDIITELKNELKELKNIFIKNTAENTRIRSILTRLTPDGDALQIKAAV